MNLKELHIRNIASIEKADIDFEHDGGLLDPYTGEPSRIFLIYGDTGTGKSILLDGIAMALFNNTPRINDVLDRANNKFRSVDGNNVNITSLEQYSRLGITYKDECYCEVRFTGNDGLDYRARMELGYTSRGNSKKKWLLSIDGAQFVEVKNVKRGDPVTPAVGLSFQQFNRMAMLAQGQFASFLCGDRDTRADILEKLTNTEHFSKYGEAIAELSREKNAALKAAHARTETVQQMIIAPDEVAALQKQENDAKALIDNANAAIAKINERIASIERLMAELEKLKNATDELHRQNEIAHGEEYAANKNLFTDWDNTDTERKALDVLIANRGMLANEQQNEQRHRAQFEMLSNALREFGNVCSQEEKAFNDEEAWLEQHRSLDSFYSNAKTTLGELKLYDTYRRALDDLYKDKKLAEEGMQGLAKAVDNARNAKGLAEQSLNQCDEALAQLSARIVSMREEAEQKQQAAADQYKQKQQALAEVRERFATNKASLDDKLCELRKKIVSGYADICPLCGQKISDAILTQEQFADIISPFEEDQKKAQRDADAAKTAFDNAVADSKKAVDEVQKQLDDKQKERTALDKRKSETEKQCILAETAVKNNAEKIAHTEGRIKKGEEELAKKEAEISAVIDTWWAWYASSPACGTPNTNISTHQHINISTCQNWKDDVATTRDILAALSEEYLDRKNRQQQRKQSLDKRKTDFKNMSAVRDSILTRIHNGTQAAMLAASNQAISIDDFHKLETSVSLTASAIENCNKNIASSETILTAWYSKTGHTECDLQELASKKDSVAAARSFVNATDNAIALQKQRIADAEKAIRDLNGTQAALPAATGTQAALLAELEDRRQSLAKWQSEKQSYERQAADAHAKIDNNSRNLQIYETVLKDFSEAKRQSDHWKILNDCFGGNRLRNLVQTYILQPLLNNANIYLSQITDRYSLTCSGENEQLAILVLDRYNRNDVRSVAVLSGGERFMISLALSLALSSLTRPDMNVNILFIDEGFGTLDQECLDSVMKTLGRLGEMTGQGNRRVGIITHREELLGCIPNRIRLSRIGQGRSRVDVVYEP